MSHTSRIGFYCSSVAWGGLEMNTVRYAKWMSDRGWNVIVFCVENSHIHQHAGELKLEIILVKRNRKYFDWLNAFRVKRLFDQHGISLCWFRDTRDFDLLGWVKRFGNGHLKLLYQQAMQFGVSKKDFMHTFRFAPIDVWISTLHFLADQVKSQTHFPPEKIHVIPLGVDETSWLKNPISTLDARATLKLPQDAIVAGIIGRIDPLKGQHLALDAFLQLADQYPRFHLLIFGESTLHEGNEYEKQLHQVAIDSKFSDRIHFRPYSKNVQLFYQSIDMFLMCSKGETFGTVTIEAMCFSKPVIATNSSGSPEILDGGKCGMLFEPGDVQGLKSAMSVMLEHPNTAAEFSKLGRKRFELLFSSSSSLDALEKVVNDTLKGN